MVYFERILSLVVPGSLMARKPVSNLFLILLILLLGTQLTGLSCLNERRSLPLHASPGLSNQFQAGAMAVGQVGDDGCPCHLAFVSIPNPSPESCCPISLLDIGAPATLVPGHTSRSFHPPLTL